MTENVQTAPAARAGAGAAEAAAEGKKKPARWGGKGLAAAIAACAAVVAAGVALWGVQLTGGMGQTAMRNYDSWGLYITTFMFFVGLSAGGLIISSIPKAFGMEGFGGISKVAIWSSICCTCVAVGFVVVDLGNPSRLWELFAYSNLSSPLMWDILVISTYLVLSLFYLWATVRHEAGRVSHAAMRAVSVLALVCAVLVHSVTAWIFSLNAAHEFWHTALMAPWFVVSALECGVALVLVVCIALRRAGYLGLEQGQVVRLAKLLGAFCVVDLYFFGCDLLTEGFPGGDGLEVVRMLTTGALAPFFWCEVACCVVAAVVCFTPALRRTWLVAAASCAAMLGVFCKRVQLLVGGFQIANIDYTQVVTQYTVTDSGGTLASAFEGLVYWPTALEVGISVAVVALGVMLFLLGLRYLPLRPAEGGE